MAEYKSKSRAPSFLPCPCQPPLILRSFLPFNPFYFFHSSSYSFRLPILSMPYVPSTTITASPYFFLLSYFFLRFFFFFFFFFLFLLAYTYVNVHFSSCLTAPQLFRFDKFPRSLCSRQICLEYFLFFIVSLTSRIKRTGILTSLLSVRLFYPALCVTFNCVLPIVLRFSFSGDVFTIFFVSSFHSLFHLFSVS